MKSELITHTPRLELIQDKNIGVESARKHHRGRTFFEETDFMILQSPQSPGKTQNVSPNVSSWKKREVMQEEDFIYALPIVKKAVNLFKKALIFSQNSSFKECNAQFINDASYFPPHKVPLPSIRNPFLRGFLLQFRIILAWSRLFPVFDPFGKLRLIWDLVIFIPTFILLFWVPIQIGFLEYLPERWYRLFFWLFISDMVVNMNTSYVHEGYVIKDRYKTFYRYFRHHLIYDLLSSLSFAFSPNTKFQGKPAYLFLFEWLFFLRLRNFKIIYERFLEWVYSKLNIRDSYIDLINLIFTNMFIIQIFACVWHYLPYYDLLNNNPDDSINWLKKIGIEKEPWEIRYQYSVYWSAVTVMTVGYGDITPQNTQEMIFTIIAICFGCGLAGFVITAIGNIFNEFSRGKQAFKQNLYVMNNYMNRKKISSELQMKIRQYLKFIAEEELTQNAEMEHKIIGKLSKKLKDQLFIEANGKVLNKYPMFFANFSEQFLRALLYQMKDARFNPGELIFSEGEPDDCEIYFVLKGEVDITSNCINRFRSYMKRSIATLKEGAVFGEMGFFTGQTRTVSAHSKDFSSVLYIRREDFLATLKKFVKDYERFCEIRDQISINNNYKPLNMKCMACHLHDHLAINCPLLHFNKDHWMKKMVIMTQQKSRRSFIRMKNKSCHALRKLGIIQQKTDKIQKKLPQVIASILKADVSEMPGEIPEESMLSFADRRIEDQEREEEKRRNLFGLRLSVPKWEFPRETILESGILQSRFESTQAKLHNRWRPEDFEKFHLFHYYYPGQNHKKLRKKVEPPKKEDEKRNRSIKIKFLNYFLEKENPSLESQKQKLALYKKFFDLQGFAIRRNRNSYFFADKNDENPKKEDANKSKDLYEVVYEVLTQDDIRAKLKKEKKTAQTLKKKENKNILI